MSAFLNACLIATLATALSAQSAPKATPAPQAPATPAPQAKPAPDLDTTYLKEFKSQVFEIRYVSPHELRSAIYPLRSGLPGCSAEATDGTIRTLTVRDLPANLAVIEAAIKRLDVPTSVTRQEVEINIHILFAHKSESAGEALPDDLKDVAKAIRGTLPYKSFTHVTTFSQRTRGTNPTGGKGSPEFEDKNTKGPNRLDLSWWVRSVRVAQVPDSPTQMTFSGFQVTGETKFGQSQMKIDTDVTLREGEKVVVGTSALNDKGLIVVLTANVLK